MYIIFVRFNSIYTKMIIEELAGGKNNRLLQSFCWLFEGVYTCIMNILFRVKMEDYLQNYSAFCKC